MQKITLTNDFHCTEITLHIRRIDSAGRGFISAQQAKKSWQVLCGINECTCGNELGARGKQPWAFSNSRPSDLELVPIDGGYLTAARTFDH